MHFVLEQVFFLKSLFHCVYSFFKFSFNSTLPFVRFVSPLSQTLNHIKFKIFPRSPLLFKSDRWKEGNTKFSHKKKEKSVGHKIESIVLYLKSLLQGKLETADICVESK